MKSRKISILTVVIMVAVLTGCGAAMKDTLEESPKAVRESILQPNVNEKYQFANDGAVYVDTYEKNKIEQWSLEGALQQTYTLPVEKKDSYVDLLYVNNEELFYGVYESAYGDDVQIMRVPIRQTETGQELLLDSQEFFRTVADVAGYGEYSCIHGPAFYANRDYIVWICSYYVEEYGTGDAGQLHVYDRKAEKELTIKEDMGIAENEEINYYLSDTIVSVCSNICGDSIIFNTDPLDEKEEKYGFSIYSFGEEKIKSIDERCYTEAAYITDQERRKVYYQITEDQSVWEYDCESGKKRELISEQAFQSCYEKEGIKWFAEEDYDSFFLQGDTLYIIKEKDPTGGPKIFSYSLQKGSLQYERAVSKKLKQCVEEIEQENGADRYYDSAIVILEGKLLHYTDYEQYYCIDLETAEAKRVYADDVEKLYFALMGEKVEVQKEAAEPKETEQEENLSEYYVENNPIDQYYMPIIYSENASQAEIRGAQDTYRGVWKEEFKHLMKCLRKKCVYDEDKKNIDAMEEQVLTEVKRERKVWETELLNAYPVNPDPQKVKSTFTRISMYGNGTRSRLNQLEGEAYRDACMRIIKLYGGIDGEEYEFRKLDYSKISYE